MKTLSTEFSNDMCQIQNLVHALKVLNNDTMQGINDLIYKSSNEQRDEVILDNMMNNGFAVETLLNIIDKIRFDNKMTDYENAIYSAENKHSVID